MCVSLDAGGVQNSGVATFESTPGVADCTTVTLRMSYTLPDIAGPLVETLVAQNFVKRTLLSTMERFRLTLEAEAAGAAEACTDAEVRIDRADEESMLEVAAAAEAVDVTVRR